MMYPRLALLRQFLSEDGIIFLNIDENEHRYAELLMDEIFGPANRINTLIWKKSYGGGSKSKHIVNLHEYVLCFAKNKERIGTLNLPPDATVLKYYKLRDSKFETRGPYRLQPLATNSMDARPNLCYSIPYDGMEIWPEKQWQWAKERTFRALENDELSIAKSPKGKWTVNYKQYLCDDEGEERTSKMYSIIEGIYTQKGTNEISAIFGDGKIFPFPKPPDLIAKFVEIATAPGDLILDSFGGSGTTGHAVLKLNSSYTGVTRRFILVEMESTVARNITAERVRRVAEGYTNAKGEKVPGLGGGFRFCELGEPLFDETGHIRETVKFGELARHVYFCETREPLPRERVANTPLLGVCRGLAVYLLFNGILGDKSSSGGNVLTRKTLAKLPPFKGPKVIYCAGCLIGAERLAEEGITVRQTPYEIRVS